MLKEDGLTIYNKMKKGKPKFEEEKHCSLIIEIMGNKKKGIPSHFCVEVGISDQTFYNWLRDYEIFQECYSLGKMISRINWENDGMEIRDEVIMPGTSNYKFEHWRMVGWSRFGIGKNSRIRLDLKPDGTPNEHYSQLLQQASNGDFTAGEIKQLMEAINVGLSAHQTFKMQQELDQLKADLVTLNENSNGNNTFTDKRIEKKD